MKKMEACEKVYFYDEKGFEYIKSKEGCVLKLYNNGQTIGYGFDWMNFPNVKINYLEDGSSISQEEADRLLRITLNRLSESLNDYLKEIDANVDQATYNAMLDLCYNRSINSMTKEVVKAMAQGNDEKVQELFKDFDYKYAIKYLDMSETEAYAFIQRNPGLETRRKEEYNLYKYGQTEPVEN